MKKKLVLFTVFAFILFLAGSCGGMKPPLNQITDAKMAISKAQALEAEHFAPLYFLKAKEKLQGAEGAVKEGNHETALELALKAKADAELAAALSKKKVAEEKAKTVIEKD